MKKGSRRAFKLKHFFYIGTLALAIGVAVSLLIVSLNLSYASAANVDFSVCLSLLFSFAVLSYLLHKGKRPKAIIGELGLSRKAFTWRALGWAILLFLAFLAFAFVVGILSAATGAHVSSNVAQTVGWFPIWALVFVSVIAPLNEEIAFRGFLVPRIGIVLSAIIFALMHFGYMSYLEIAGALWFGLVAGYVFKKTKSLYPSLIAHIAVNSFTLSTLFVAVHWGSSLFILVH